MREFLEKLQTEGYMKHMVDVSKHLSKVGSLGKRDDIVRTKTVGAMLGMIFETDEELCDAFTDAVWDIGVQCVADAIKIEIKRDTTEDDASDEVVKKAIVVLTRSLRDK